jgi:hypothetical protein
VDPLDFLEDLLGDVAVGDVPLLGGTQLHEVVDLPQVPGEQDPLPERQGQDVLRLPREVLRDDPVPLLSAGRAFLVRRQ